MNDELVCWRCGAGLNDTPLPLARRAECHSCGSELHVCRMCRHYDTSVSRSCREPVAEEVGDKQRANFCGWFMPRANAWTPGNERAAVDSRAALDALFGGGGSATPAKDRGAGGLEDLFGSTEPDEPDER
jgi:hypothetical protein